MYTTLVSTAELSQHSTAPDWIIIDCRHDLTNPDAGHVAYAAGHIPNAHFAHLDRDLSGEKIGANGQFFGRHPLPNRSDFIETMRRFGISDTTQVIAYDAHGGMFAARLWWLLRWVGHGAVAVLDGGLPAWQAGGLTLSTDIPAASKGSLPDKAPLVSVVSAAALVRNLIEPQFTVIDARAPDRYRGENETLDPVGGHIPGAKNRFFKDNLPPHGRFKFAQDLHNDFASLIETPLTAVMQCGSGVTACHNLLALEVAGLSGAALYPGSWSEWCSDQSRPVAVGA